VSIVPVVLCLGLACAAARGQFDIVHAFAGGNNDGQGPGQNSGVAASGSTLYGMTQLGGTDNVGVLFKVNTNGSGYQVLRKFAGKAPGLNDDGSVTDGALPLGTPVISGTTLYGMTSMGGADGFGTIFKVETNGTGFALLHSFLISGNDGHLPIGSLLLDGDVLYGLTPSGGTVSAIGTLFSIHTDGSNYLKLHDFDVANDGIVTPQGSLTISGTTLYGTCQMGGPIGGGGVFRIETNGTGYQVVHNFVGSGTDGYGPTGPLVVDGTTIYGTTQSGGAGGVGCVFRMDTSGANAQLLKSFTISSYSPYGGLVLDGTTLYGMNHSGDLTGGAGCVFKLGVDGSGYENIHPFKFPITMADGMWPWGTPILIGDTLYGTTPLGGSSANGGCVFSLNKNGDGGGGDPGPGNGKPGTLRFSAPAFTAKESTATATIVVTRVGGASGTVSVDCDSTNGTALVGEDYAEVDKTLTFPQGVKKLLFTVDVLNDGSVELPEDFTLTLENPTGGAAIDPLHGTALATILDDDTAHVASALDADGDKLTIKLGGPGEMDVTTTDTAAVDGVALLGAGAGALAIELNGTTSASSLNVKVAKGPQGDGLVTIHSIVGDGDLKVLNAKGVDLAGEGLVLGGSLGTVTIHDLHDGATLTAGGDPTDKTTINAHVLDDDTSVSLGSSLAKLTAARVGACSLSAPSAGTLTIKGDKKAAIDGDFAGALQLSGDGVADGKPVLGKLTAKGSLASASLRVEGSIDNVTADAIADTVIFAGYVPGDEADPLAGGTFAPGLAIKAVTAKAKSGAFVASTIAAASVGAVKLTSVDTDNGGTAFGVLADESIGSVKVTTPKFTWSPQGAADQGVGDFHVKH